MLNEMKSRFLSGKKILVILVMLVAMNASAQWVQIKNGINRDSTIYCLCASGTNIFAGTVRLGVLKSTNNGADWNETGLGNSYYIQDLGSKWR